MVEKPEHGFGDPRGFIGAIAGPEVVVGPVERERMSVECAGVIDDLCIEGPRSVGFGFGKYFDVGHSGVPLGLVRYRGKGQ